MTTAIGRFRLRHSRGVGRTTKLTGDTVPEYSESSPRQNPGLPNFTTISAITFPDTMKADVSALISAETKQAQLENTLSQQANPNADTLDYNALNAAGNDSTAASGVLRHDLGLPPVPPV
jgi:hypothetical protein